MLTEKQKRFADLYLELGDGTEAYIRAGYRVKNRDVAAAAGRCADADERAGATMLSAAYGTGLSYANIADELKLSRHSVRTFVDRARAKVQQGIKA